MTTVRLSSDLANHSEGMRYVKVMLDAAKASGVPVDQICFHFAGVNGLPDIKGYAIQQKVNAYLKSGQSTLSPETIQKLQGASFADDATQLYAYPTALKFRGESFHNAAKLILRKTEMKEDIRQTALNTLDKMQQAYVENIYIVENHTVDVRFRQASYHLTAKGVQDDAEQQAHAHYERYLAGIIHTLQPIFPNTSYEQVRSHLGNAETITNTKLYKTQINVLGDLSNIIHFQIDRARNTFADLGKMQKARWNSVYECYKSHQSIPPGSEWFTDAPQWEQAYWMEIVEQARNGNSHVAIAPVVKKGGMPGLRNVFESSYASAKFEEKRSANISAAPPSIRSANLVVSLNEGVVALSAENAAMTRENILQVITLYPRNYAYSTRFPWPLPTKPILLCQTLIRGVGGGDDHVLIHKKAAINAVAAERKDVEIIGTNHSIGAQGPGGVKTLWRKHEDSANAVITKIVTSIKKYKTTGGGGSVNTLGVEHVRKPIASFLQQSVWPELQRLFLQKTVLSDLQKKEWSVAQSRLQQCLEWAANGKLNLSNLNENIPKTIHVDQRKHLLRIFLALNNYAIVEKEKNYDNNYHLHLAAMEEIIYQYTGNLIQSSCKSGKDREGIEKCYRNALEAYYHEYGSFPPVGEPQAERKKFIIIFIKFFKSNHQACLAELNAMGCRGQKALGNILPKDIYEALEKDPLIKSLLNSHKKNAKLNAFGHSKVKAVAITTIYGDAKQDTDALLKVVRAKEKIMDESDNAIARALEGAFSMRRQRADSVASTHSVSSDDEDDFVLVENKLSGAALDEKGGGTTPRSVAAGPAPNNVFHEAKGESAALTSRVSLTAAAAAESDDEVAPPPPSVTADSDNDEVPPPPPPLSAMQRPAC